VCDVVDRLLYSTNILVGDAEAVRAARSVYEHASMGFADCLIGSMNMSSGFVYTLTFDKKASRSAGFRNVRERR
jgi:predicted nucleic-acid-binding protein